MTTPHNMDSGGVHSGGFSRSVSLIPRQLVRCHPDAIAVFADRLPALGDNGGENGEEIVLFSRPLDGWALVEGENGGTAIVGFCGYDTVYLVEDLANFSFYARVGENLVSTYRTVLGSKLGEMNVRMGLDEDELRRPARTGDGEGT